MKIFSRLARADDQKADSNGRVNAVFASPNLALDDHLLLQDVRKKLERPRRNRTDVLPEYRMSAATCA